MKNKFRFGLLRSWLAYMALPASTIITAPILAHALGPEGRGQLAGILQPLTLAVAVAAFGVPSAVTFFIGRGYRSASVIKSALRLISFMTIVVGIALAIYANPLSDNLKINQSAIYVIWGVFIPISFISIRRAHVQALRIYSSLDLERLLISIFRIILIIALWAMGIESVPLFCGAYLLPGICAAVALRIPARTKTNDSNEGVLLDRGVFTRFAGLASFGAIATALNARLDQAILPAAVSPRELGYYSIAVSVAEVTTIITMVASRNVLAEAASGRRFSLIARDVAIGGIAQVVLIGVLAASASTLIPVIFGASFSPSVNLVYILLLATFLGYCVNVSTAFFCGLGRPGFGSFGQAAASITTVVLFWSSWTEMNSTVAAWICVWSQVIALSCSGVLVLRILRKDARQDIVSDPRMARTPRPIFPFDPARLWFLASQLHRSGKRRLARLIKAYVFWVFRAALPPEAELSSIPKLGHWGLNIVVHPNVSLGRDIMIWHNVTLSVSDSPGAESRLVIGDRVTIGTGCVIITPFHKSLTICSDVKIGANAVVTKSINKPGTYVGSPARLVSASREDHKL